MVEKQPLQQIILAFLLLWALAAQLTYSGTALYLNFHIGSYVQAPFLLSTFESRIGLIPDEYRSSELRVGDEIVALDGRPFDGAEQLGQLSANFRPGTTVRVDIRRHGKDRTLFIRLLSPEAEWIKTVGMLVVLPLSCLLVGFYIAFARPRDPLAWITMAMLASFGQLADTGIPWMMPEPWRGIVLVYHAVLSSTWQLWLLLFALYFPIPFAWWKRHSWLNWIVGLPALYMVPLSVYAFLELGRHIHRLGRIARLAHYTQVPYQILIAVYISCFFALLGFKQGIVKTPDGRRRLRVMSAGCTLAMAPLLIVVFFHPPGWVDTICLLMALFFPITMAYVIVVQRAMDIKMVVRSGVRYAFAANGIKILRAVLVAAVAIAALELEQESEHRWEGILIAAVGVALIVLVGRVARRLREWMDRRFFREAYDAELILTDLGSSVSGIRDVKTLLHTVAERLSTSLHVDKIAVLLERGMRYESAYALGYDGVQPALALAQETATIRYLRNVRSPSRVYFDDPQSWIYGTPQREQEALREMQTQLLLPLAMNNRLLGIISLGAKKSEAPYSQGDLQLLSAVASQTGLALENADLNEKIRSEITQRERLNRELEIARDVQQHLFPQKLPQVNGLDFAGYCRPAEGVGGDYYDFVRLTDGCLGVAIGDVSGKGIAAALMMASLQASLRGQTIKPCETLGEMLSNINRLVFEASAENRYATFFYAQYHPETRALRYVNAGHNAPMVLRAGGREVERLVDGGVVIGLFANQEFHEGSVKLQPGDLVLAYTDGISEAMNKNDDEYGEDQLMSALQQHRARTAADLISEILERVDRFTAGAKQHDDMTLVAVRVE